LRRDSHLLEDIRIAAGDVAEYIAGMRLADFLTDSKTKAAVERQLIIIGEAANRVSHEFKSEHPEIPWKRLAQIRNFYVHGYERLRAEEVWSTAHRFIPRVGRLVTSLIPADEDEEKA
jgi:uncharacterized protein with HEPN domain